MMNDHDAAVNLASNENLQHNPAITTAIRMFVDVLKILDNLQHSTFNIYGVKVMAPITEVTARSRHDLGIGVDLT